MDQKAFYKLSYGLYILTTSHGGKDAGCVINTLAQVTSSPAKLSIAVNKDNFTKKMIDKSGVFAAVTLTTSADMNLIGNFGFQTSENADKFSAFETKRDGNGVPYLTGHVAARYSCRVVDSLDVGSHVIYIGEVREAEVLSEEDVLTYAYYQQVKKGTTPKNAPSYKEEAPKKGYRCSVCGYYLESDTIPEGFVCPICGQGPDKLVKL